MYTRRNRGLIKPLQQKYKLHVIRDDAVIVNDIKTRKEKNYSTIDVEEIWSGTLADEREMVAAREIVS